MRTCVDEHEGCRETLSGSLVDGAIPPILPTRVVCVESPDEGVSPRLLETHGNVALRRRLQRSNDLPREAVGGGILNVYPSAL
jgi:hypothetical protein